MKQTFLHHVAQDIINKYGTDLSHVAVVFPNKRASLFLNQELAAIAGKPIWSPNYITISDLFRRHSKRVVADEIELICQLYQVFTKCTRMNETLDHFFGWGQVMLADFDDIDKNMVDAQKIFANLRDIHELDDISYLTDEQKKHIKRFFSTFSDEQNTELKRLFLDLWSQLGNIYSAFNTQLKAAGKAYEGALYREVASNEDIEFEHDTYLFVGFNLLLEVEQTLFKRLQKEGRAYFYWDFDQYYMNGNEAGHYISSYLKIFPNELDNADEAIYNNMAGKKDISYIAATTENIQARYIASWLRENERIDAGNRTAIVMCDENLLQTVVHCLPPEVEQVNITTGYPLKQTPVASLISTLINLQTLGCRGNQYRLHYVNTALRHPYTRLISQQADTLYTELNIQRHYFPRREELTKDEGLALLFAKIDNENPIEITQWLLQIIEHIARNAKEENKKEPLFQESLFRMHTLLNRLHEIIQTEELDIELVTYQRFVNQLIATTKIPFHGEPAVGLQIMGVLETRNLDFDHLLILSCNEGNMPKGINDTSFIPHSLRMAYNLTTIDHKVGIYAYYFNRLLQRAGDITILYSNANANGKPQGISRFMLQLLVESRHEIKRLALHTGQKPIILKPKEIEKDAEVMRKLYELGGVKSKEQETTDGEQRADDTPKRPENNRKAEISKFISPTVINRYLRCPLQFYYNHLAGIKEPDNTDIDEIDNRMFGNIFHLASQLIYEPLMTRGQLIQKQDIEDLLNHKDVIERAVDKAFQEELGVKSYESGATNGNTRTDNLKSQTSKSGHQNLNGLHLINRRVIIHYMEQLLKIDAKLTPFKVQGLEKDVFTTIQLTTSNGSFELNVGGKIDRLDEVDGTLRIIDYKTGSRQQQKMGSVEDIFDPSNIEKHSDYYLQTMLYALIVRAQKEYNPNSLPASPALLFIQHTTGENYDPTLVIDKLPVCDIRTYAHEFKTSLIQLLEEIFNPQIPFRPTAQTERCNRCVYRQICGL